jgi:hypothetical protein
LLGLGKKTDLACRKMKVGRIRLVACRAVQYISGSIRTKNDNNTATYLPTYLSNRGVSGSK